MLGDIFPIKKINNMHQCLNFIFLKSDMVLTKKQLFEQLMQQESYLHLFGVTKLGVFGSFVTNKINNESDIDFLVEFDPSKKTYKNFLAVSDFLEKKTGRKVEIVTQKSLNKYLAPTILAQTEYVF